MSTGSQDRTDNLDDVEVSGHDWSTGRTSGDWNFASDSEPDTSQAAGSAEVQDLWEPLPGHYPSLALDREKNDFRLLHILPALSNVAPIRCGLKIESLETPVQYEAVSYTWGASLLQQIVFVAIAIPLRTTFSSC
jgi:hypothetical protein